MTLAGKNILVGICGGIAAYKTPSLIRALLREGASVQAVLTENGSRFTGRATLSTLTKRAVLSDLFPEGGITDTEHIAASDWAHLLLVAPATANCLGKFASGIADDFLSTLFLSLKTPVVLAPSMNSAMWDNPAVQANTAILRKRGVTLLEPESGELACGTTGKGRLPSEAAIVAAVKKALTRQDLSGKRILITAGGTEEAIDPVRVISNKSSGRMGVALAENAQARGALVTLVHAAVTVPLPQGITAVSALSTEAMQKSVLSLFQKHDILIMAAAISDFRPVKSSQSKIKKSGKGLLLELAETPDIVKAAGRQKGKRKIIGFALENAGDLNRARQKLKDKNCDLLVFNTAVSLGSDLSDAVLLDKKGGAVPLNASGKADAAAKILDAVARL